MKYQLIMLDQPILVSDEEIAPCSPSNICMAHITKPCDKCGRYQGKKTYKVDLSELSEEDCKKIGWVDVENLAMKECVCGTGNCVHVKSYIRGFKTAQSLNEKRFSLEDIEKAITKAWYKGAQESYKGKTLVFDTDVTEIIKSISQPKVFDVEVEMEATKMICDEPNCIIPCACYHQGKPTLCQGGTTIWEPKITNNSIKIIKVL